MNSSLSIIDAYQSISMILVGLFAVLDQFTAGTPYKWYVPRQLPASVAAIQHEVDKIKRASFIKTSININSAPMVCVPNPNGNIHVCINLQRVNLNVVNDLYLMH